MLSKSIIMKAQNELKNVSVGIIGDFCVDIYWNSDMTKSELSRETPHFPLPVVGERVYLGAGGNVAANIAALNPGKLYAMSLYGDDWRGMLMRDCLEKAGIDSSLFIETPGRFTNAYCKPIRRGISAVEYEDPRLDFTNYSPIDRETEDKIIGNLDVLAQKVQVLCVADQFACGIVTDRVREKIIQLAENGITVIADSRYNIGKYTDCILKPNEVECWRAVYGDERYIDASYDEFVSAAKMLAEKNRCKVFCTLGARGSVFTDGTDTDIIDAVKADGEIDICGAGDTSLSAFSCAIAAGLGYADAAALAGMASRVTVKKIGITGTASFDEIICLAE